MDTEAVTWLESDGCWEFGVGIRGARGQREIMGVDILAGRPSRLQGEAGGGGNCSQHL